MNDTITNIICSVFVGLAYKYLYAIVLVGVMFMRGTK